MILPFQLTYRGAADSPQRITPRAQEHGFAVLVVFLLMLMMMALVIQSGLVLRGLRQELKLVEKRQIKRYPAAMMATNAIRPNLPVSTNTVTAIPHE